MLLCIVSPTGSTGRGCEEGMVGATGWGQPCLSRGSTVSELFTRGTPGHIPAHWETVSYCTHLNIRVYHPHMLTEYTYIINLSCSCKYDLSVSRFD